MFSNTAEQHSERKMSSIGSYSADESYSMDEFCSSDESRSSYSSFKRLAKPASAETTLVPEDWESTISFWNDGVKVSGRSSFTSLNETFECEPPVTPLKDDTSINIQPDDSTPALDIFPSDALLVKPASAENTLVLKNWDCAVSFWNDGVQVSGRSSFTSSNEIFECEPPATPPKDDTSINIQPDDSTPALDIFPSDVILVKPASSENTLVLEDWDCAVSFWNDGAKVSGRSSFTSSNETFEHEPPVTPLKDDASINVQPDDSTPALHIFPSDALLVEPVSAESSLVLEDWDCADSVWNDEVEILVDILPSDEILVRPETAENAPLHEDQESVASFQSELDKASESLISEESITHEDIGANKKRKKNRVRRFFSWMRKTFCCCVACVDDD